MAKFEAHEEIIETMVDFKKGLRTLETGTKVLAEQTGLEEDVARALLRGMNKSYSTVTQIRGYSKEKPYQIEGKKKKRLLKLREA